MRRIKLTPTSLLDILLLRQHSLQWSQYFDAARLDAQNAASSCIWSGTVRSALGFACAIYWSARTAVTVIA